MQIKSEKEEEGREAVAARSSSPTRVPTEVPASASVPTTPRRRGVPVRRSSKQWQLHLLSTSTRQAGEEDASSDHTRAGGFISRNDDDMGSDVRARGGRCGGDGGGGGGIIDDRGGRQWRRWLAHADQGNEPISPRSPSEPGAARRRRVPLNDTTPNGPTARRRHNSLPSRPRHAVVHPGTGTDVGSEDSAPPSRRVSSSSSRGRTSTASTFSTDRRTSSPKGTALDPPGTFREFDLDCTMARLSWLLSV